MSEKEKLLKDLAKLRADLASREEFEASAVLRAACSYIEDNPPLRCWGVGSTPPDGLYLGRSGIRGHAVLVEGETMRYWVDYFDPADTEKYGGEKSAPLEGYLRRGGKLYGPISESGDVS